MELLKNVLIKEVDGTKVGDKVFYVDNLPKSLIYQKVAKLVIDRSNPQQNLVPAFRVENGIRVETGEMVDELLPGIEASQTGDGAYCFFTQYNEAKYRLHDIDVYIQQTAPVADRVATRIPYSSQPGVMSASPRPLSQIPRVVLPDPVSPPANAVQETAVAPSRTFRKPLSDLDKEAARVRMAKARAAKTTKKAVEQ